MQPVIYLDMDGVLADFDSRALELFGPDWKLELEKPGWGRFADHPDLYATLPPMPGARELYQAAVGCAGSPDLVRVLTALPRRAHGSFPDAAQHKAQWAAKHIDPSLRVYFGPFAVNKQLHVYHPHDVLIDDTRINIDQWEAAGGIGIRYTSAEAAIERLSQLKYL